MNLEEYYQKYQNKITQDSEKLFVDDFLYPLLGSNIEKIEPQSSFIDSTGKNRRIDFAYLGETSKLAFEVNGETYHAEGIIPHEMFDDNLFRQNEILASGYQLVRYSYNQLKAPQWRQIVQDTLRNPEQLEQFTEDYFNYIVIDEVHHTQSPTYKEIVKYFNPNFMLGMTATPDRTDRKDIFELFDYQKIYEISLASAIEQGYLVPYTYYGLQDNVDYSKIQYKNNKYKESDLEKLLIIPERNEAIIKEYLDKGKGDKAIGFCITQKHADRMAEVFRSNGISAEAIYSGKSDREELINKFRQNQIQVVFTVDLFNEGVDFPNVRVLLFLRPTESKTVFIQQLGRGLRLCTGKNRVTILDFIANYQRANQIRKYLAKSSNTINKNQQIGSKKKIEYQYSTGCEVYFDPSVEEILDRQDAEALGVSKEDLIDAYFSLAEKLERKPNKSDLDQEGEYKSANYIAVFGGWVKFLKEIGEFTEASYHYPQGTDLSHILSILKYFGQGNRNNTHFDDKYIRFRGNLDQGRLGSYQRQVKYKLQGAMELGIITDYRNYANDENYEPKLTVKGHYLYLCLKSELEKLNLTFELGDDGIPSTRMSNEINYNHLIREQINNNQNIKEMIYKIFLNMSAVQQMLAFIYHVCRKKEIPRQEIYEQFFQAPFVKKFCDSEGIEIATLEASKRRCPFLLNILDSCGIIDQDRNKIYVNKLVLTPYLVKFDTKENENILIERIKEIINFYSGNQSNLSQIVMLKELFSSDFLTENYYLLTLNQIDNIDNYHLVILG